MRVLISILLVTFAFCALATERSPATQPAPMECKTGPLRNTYGGSEWLVYACSDSRSVVIVTAKDSPAMPFVFMLIVDADGNIKLHGEGTGDKKHTASAFDDIKKLTVSDISKLVTLANAVVKSND